MKCHLEAICTFNRDIEECQYFYWEYEEDGGDSCCLHDSNTNKDGFPIFKDQTN